MSGKGSGVQGYRFYMSLFMGIGRGPNEELVEIKVGDKSAWAGNACDFGTTYRIDKPELFGGDDKEGGIDGGFRIFMGEDDQVLPGGPVEDNGGGGGFADIILKLFGNSRYNGNVKGSIGGFVPDMRGVTTVWFDGMVSAMSPYLKPWKFRMRRSVAGWHGGVCWYPAKATVYAAGDVLTVETNQPISFPVTEELVDEKLVTVLTFNSNPQIGDTVTVNGNTITFVEDDPDEGEIVPAANASKTMQRLVGYLKSRVSLYKVTVAYRDPNQAVFATDQAAGQVAAMNGAHVIYQCYTDPLWGRGHPREDMDDNSWTLAANTLCSEGFGIALTWQRKEDIDQFIQKMCDLVGAVTYTDRETGLTAIKLIRADYDVDDLPLFTPETGLLSIEDDDSASSDNAYNEIIGTSVDPLTNLKFQIRAQNPAARVSQGAPSSLDQDYTGIPTKALLSRVVLRDLRAMASGLKKFTLKLDRRAWRLTPGSVIRISHPGRQIANMVLRIGEIDDGNMVNGTITVKAAIDVFGLPETSYVEETGNTWSPPSKYAEPAREAVMRETSFRDAYRRLGQSDAEALDPTIGYVGSIATIDNPLLLEYELLMRPSGNDGTWTNTSRGHFAEWVEITQAAGPLDTTLHIMNHGLTDEHIGQALFASIELEDGSFYGREIVRLDAINDDGTITVGRGCDNTIPSPKLAGTTLFSYDDDLNVMDLELPRNELWRWITLTRSTEGNQDEALAGFPGLITAQGAHATPLPPGRVQVRNSGDLQFLSPLTSVVQAAEPELQWQDRNRITQADQLIDHGEGAILAEPGTTYKLRIQAGGFTIREVEGIVSNDQGVGTYTYTAAMQEADRAAMGSQFEDGLPSLLSFWLWAVRDDLESDPYRFDIAREKGYGLTYGLNWG